MSLPPEVPQPVNRLHAQPETDDRLEDVKREMTGFERGTLRWAKVAVFMSALAAIFVCLQWREMLQGGVDTHNLATAALAANRAWLGPDRTILASALEAGLPLKYQIHIVNFGKEPALGVMRNVKPIGVPYIRPIDDPNAIKMERNVTCDGLEPRSSDGMVLYPPGGGTNFWVPLDVLDTAENRQLIHGVLNRTKSLVIDGCFAYRTGGGKHSSSFRFFLRDVPGKSFVTDKDGKPVPAWNFNVTLTGNEAN